MMQRIPEIKEIPYFNIADRITINNDSDSKKELFFIEGLYEQVLHYMVQEMNRNVQGDIFRELQKMIFSTDIADGMVRMKDLFQSGGPWDHKPQLQKITLPVLTHNGSRKLFVTSIRGDKTYLYFYDIWSNIHYGYVMERLGITLENMPLEYIWGAIANLGSKLHGYFTAAKTSSKLIKFSWKERTKSIEQLKAAWDNFIVQKNAEENDLVSVAIGQRLARQSGESVSAGEVHEIIFASRTNWAENEVKYRWHGLKLYQR